MASNLQENQEQSNSLIKVLVVEDDPGDALLIQRTLLGAGSGRYAVERAADLAEAALQLAASPPDVLLLDLSLPDSRGLATVETVRRQAPQVPIVVITGHDDDELALTTLAAGAQDYLTKNALNSYALNRSIRYAVTRAGLENRLLESNQRLEGLLDEIRSLNTYDTLTGLPNRRHLLERLERGIAMHARSHHYGALLGIDLGNFRVVNDTLGNDIGDLLLIETARRLRRCVRETDTVARLGSDEFAVMLEFLSKDAGQAAIKAEEVAKKLRNSINRSFLLRNHECHVTISIGICVFGKRDELFDELLIRANVATYQAKKSGRNLIRFFDDAMQTALEERTRQEAELRRALRKNEMQLYFQPQVDQDGRPTGAEALIRWIHPQRGLIPPGDFIPLAEETGLILEMGRMVLEEACRRLREWQEQPAMANLLMAVNISAHQFRQPDFVKQVREIITAAAINPARLKLELTETALLDSSSHAAAKMKELIDLGLSISLDDFGTGYSSLSYLKQLPVNQLKIDRAFISNVANDPSDAAIVRAILAMAAELEIEVVAEGVEDRLQRDFLCRHNCHRFQGFLFARPMPAADFVAFCSRTQPPATDPATEA